MKSFLLSLCFVLIATLVGAQQLHFVYLQTDSRKPFYALLNNKNYSSSSIGYIILPKLQNGDYSIRIGFPRNEQPEQEFLVQVRNNDQGFLVKDFGDKGWGLFNLQSMDIQYAGSTAEKKNQLLAQQKAEAEKQQQAAAAERQRQADSLQAVVQAQKKALADAEAAQAALLRQQQNNDSVQQAATAANAAVQQEQALATERRRADSIQRATDAVAAFNKQKTEEEQRRITDSMQKASDVAVRKQKEETEQHRITDSLQRAADATGSTQPQKETQPVVSENERLERLADSTARAQAIAIEKVKQNGSATSIGGPVLLQKTFTDTGWRYSYSVSSNGKKESVDVFIPVGQPKMAVVISPAAQEPKLTETEPISSPPPTAATTNPETKKSNDPFLNMEFGSGGSVKMDSSANGVKVMHNSNCRAAADDKDFVTTRKKMAAAANTEKMIALARKLMKEKCYTTEQIRNLSFLFLTDADRYQFLDAAYPFTLDAYRFVSLQDLLKDDYYVQRFKTMLR